MVKLSLYSFVMPTQRHRRGTCVKDLSAIASIVAGVLAFNSAPVFACGGIFDAACNLSHGGLSPSNIQKQAEKAGQDATHVLTEPAVQAAGAALEQCHPVS